MALYKEPQYGYCSLQVNILEDAVFTSPFHGVWHASILATYDVGMDILTIWLFTL